MEQIQAVGKLQKNYNVTIPQKIRKLFHMELGDIIRFIVKDDGILIQPKKLVDTTQAYFWTNQWQEDEKSASLDIKEGRVSKTKNMKDLIKKLKAK
jgi:AbrB family looped-hinge helix DNA binding protein